MATAIDARAAWPALSEHKRLRFTSIFLLYVAQGLPIGFFQFAVPAWLAANGASAAAVGTVVSAASLPWSLKLIHGFVMDRWAFLPMGRRRPWLILAQLMIVATMLGLAVRGAAPSELALLAAFAFTANLFTTVQDVAIDGMAIDLIPEEERGRANGFMFGGQALGMAIGTSMTGYALYHGGMSLAAFLGACAVAAPLSLIMLLRERPGERLMPWSDGAASAHAVELHAGAWLPILTGVFRATFRLNTLMFLMGTLLAGATLGIFYAVSPLIGTRVVGWSDAQVSALSGTGNLVGALVAIVAIGWLADRIGARRAAIGIALSGGLLALGMLALQDNWALPAIFSAFVILFLVQNTATSTANCAVSMRLCERRVGATQFGLFMAVGNFGISIGAAFVGTLDDLGGMQAMITAMAAAHLGAALLFLLAKVGR